MQKAVGRGKEWIIQLAVTALKAFDQPVSDFLLTASCLLPSLFSVSLCLGGKLR